MGSYKKIYKIFMGLIPEYPLLNNLDWKYINLLILTPLGFALENTCHETAEVVRVIQI